MPKTNNALTKPKTGPGQSYTVPESRLLGFDCEADGSEPRVMVALDHLECAMLERAAREVAKAAFPRSRAELVLPIGEHKGVTCLYSSGRFPFVIRDAGNRQLDAADEGATVRFRVMLKAYRVGDRIEVFAFPSRLDVLADVPVLARESPKAAPTQLAMVLEPPPVTKPSKATKPPKPKKPAPAVSFGSNVIIFPLSPTKH